MSFICDFCSKSIRQGVKPIMVVLPSDIRSMSYVNEVPDPDAIENPFSTRAPKTITKVSTGSEWVAEMKSCAECQGLPVHPEAVIDFKPIISIVKGMQAYARKSNKKLDEDKLLQRNLISYHEVPLHILAEALEDRKVPEGIPAGKWTFANTAHGNMVKRAQEGSDMKYTDGSIAKRGNKRGLADFYAAAPLFMQFENTGGKL